MDVLNTEQPNQADSNETGVPKAHLDQVAPQVQPIGDNSHRTVDKHGYARDTIESLEERINREIDHGLKNNSASVDLADQKQDLEGSDIDIEKVEEILKSNTGTALGDYSEAHLPQL